MRGPVLPTILTILLLDETYRSRELRKWSPNETCLEVYVNSPNKNYRKCLENIEENVQVDLRA